MNTESSRDLHRDDPFSASMLYAGVLYMSIGVFFMELAALFHYTVSAILIFEPFVLGVALIMAALLRFIWQCIPQYRARQERAQHE